MNALVFQLTVIFVPGLIWFAVVNRLTSTAYSVRSDLAILLRTFAFGLTSYFLWFIVYYLYFRIRWGCWPSVINVDITHVVEQFQILRGKDVLWSSVLAFLLSILWSFAANRKYFVRSMQWMHITSKFGDEGVWEYTLNMNRPVSEFVNVRDMQNKLVFGGFVKAFSEGGVQCELLLEKVRVYDMDSNLLYEMPHVYLARKRDDLYIEFPYIEPEATPSSATHSETDRNSLSEVEVTDL